MPTMSVLWQGSVMKALRPRRVTSIHACAILAAAISIPRSIHQQQMRSASTSWLGSMVQSASTLSFVCIDVKSSTAKASLSCEGPLPRSVARTHLNAKSYCRWNVGPCPRDVLLRCFGRRSVLLIDSLTEARCYCIHELDRQRRGFHVPSLCNAAPQHPPRVPRLSGSWCIRQAVYLLVACLAGLRVGLQKESRVILELKPTSMFDRLEQWLEGEVVFPTTPSMSSSAFRPSRGTLIELMSFA